MADRPREPLIPSRVMLIGEGQMPVEVIEALDDRLLHIFMREPDPEKWPSEMDHLIRYLSPEEQTTLSVSKILRRHDSLLRESLEIWAVTVWEDFLKTEVGNRGDRDKIVEEMAAHVKTLLADFLKEIS